MSPDEVCEPVVQQDIHGDNMAHLSDTSPLDFGCFPMSKSSVLIEIWPWSGYFFSIPHTKGYLSSHEKFLTEIGNGFFRKKNPFDRTHMSERGETQVIIWCSCNWKCPSHAPSPQTIFEDIPPPKKKMGHIPYQYITNEQVGLPCKLGYLIWHMHFILFEFCAKFLDRFPKLLTDGTEVFFCTCVNFCCIKLLICSSHHELCVCCRNVRMLPLHIETDKFLTRDRK